MSPWSGVHIAMLHRPTCKDGRTRKFCTFCSTVVLRRHSDRLAWDCAHLAPRSFPPAFAHAASQGLVLGPVFYGLVYLKHGTVRVGVYFLRDKWGVCDFRRYAR